MSVSSPALPGPAITKIHRQQFSALQNKRYFNFGGQGPMAQAALEAIHAAHQQIQQKGPFSQEVNHWINETTTTARQSIATELGAAAPAIALTENVTVGCNIALWGIAWQAGDRIVLSDCEHPGVIAAVQEISRRFQVEVAVCPVLSVADPAEVLDNVAQSLTDRTRLLVISHILWNTGRSLPLSEIVALCHQHTPDPVWVLVDAAQSVGVLPLNLTELPVDFYAFTGHKWWCGPAGVGGLYVRPELLDFLHPTFIGWRGITVDGAANPAGWQSGARRFEVATSDYPLMAGLKTAIAIQNQWGTAEQRYQRICQLSQRLWQQLGELPNLHRLCATPPPSGLVSFQLGSAAAPNQKLQTQLVQHLEKQGFFVRTLLNPHCVRACVHYLSLETEVDQLTQAIADFLAGQD
ncbi:aminotransferase class V-fold PLP-dependent enzyme [Sphaerothrix gracilis]|uniref:aminotransferase class V-fold PLP-dependent enzyme n=1 Tax=Sphaerothrix gracilis TaxID=3151835 RepID=UPI0031FD2FCA